MLTQNHKGIMLINPSWASLLIDFKPFLNRQDERKANRSLCPETHQKCSCPWLGDFRNHFTLFHWNSACKVSVTFLAIIYVLLWGGFCIAGKLILGLGLFCIDSKLLEKAGTSFYMCESPSHLALCLVSQAHGELTPVQSAQQGPVSSSGQCEFLSWMPGLRQLIFLL